MSNSWSASTLDRLVHDLMRLRHDPLVVPSDVSFDRIISFMNDHDPADVYLLMVADIAKAARLGMRWGLNYDREVWITFYEYCENASVRDVKDSAGLAQEQYHRQHRHSIDWTGRLQEHASRDGGTVCNHIASLSKRGQKREWYKKGLIHHSISLELGKHQDTDQYITYAFDEAAAMLKDYFRLGISPEDIPFAETMYRTLYQVGAEIYRRIRDPDCAMRQQAAIVVLHETYFNARTQHRREAAERLYDSAVLLASMQPGNAEMMRLADKAAEYVIQSLYAMSHTHGRVNNWSHDISVWEAKRERVSTFSGNAAFAT